MNEIAKRATAERFLKALRKERLSKTNAGANIGLTPAQVSYLFNDKFWDRLGITYWEKVLKWANSGYSLMEYPKHYPDCALKPKAEEVTSTKTDVKWQHTDAKSPCNDDEIMEVDFEDPNEESNKEETLPVPADPITATIDASDSIIDFIKNNACMVLTKDGDSYYWLPFWFCFQAVNGDKRIVMHHLDHLPKDLMNAIKAIRGD